MFGFHAIWLVMVFLVVAVPIALTVLVVTLGTRSRGASPAPLFSPDGRWWWDGRQWQPVPRPPEPPSPPVSG